MTLLTYLRADLAPLMKRRDKVTLRAVRDVIGLIENAETTYVAPVTRSVASNEFIAGTVAFGSGDRVVASLTDAQMMDLAKSHVDRLLEDSRRFRESGRIDEALTHKAEALALSDRLDAYPG